MFQDGPIAGVICKQLTCFEDERGWLIEIYRHDELDSVYHPVMTYVSMTHPDVTRGPHEHHEQADLFGFIGPSQFKVYMWDNRPDSPTYRNRQSVVAGEGSPQAIVIPPGVVHAYRNIGNTPGLVFNAPNQLYRGEGKRDSVDEIRHENKTDTEFTMD